MAGEESFVKANEAFVEEDYEEAIKLYSKALDEDGERADYYVNRSQAYIKLEQYNNALKDAESAIKINPKNPKAWLRKGVANFHLNNILDAHKSFSEGKSLDSSDKTISNWIEKCESSSEWKDAVEKSKAEKDATQEKTSETKDSGDSKPAQIPMPAGAKTRYDWYQTETHVVISVMLKNQKKDNVNCDIQEKTFSLTVQLDTGNEYSLELDLAHPVVPNQSGVKILSTKIEIKLKKSEGIRWAALEDKHAPNAVKQFKPSGADAAAATKYPSSSHYTRDWDKLVADIKKEEKDEKVEGDHALNQLFQQIYSDGNDETRKAMNKSFVESGGTVLSTNWNEIANKKTEIKPPDGMEHKKYEY